MKRSIILLLSLLLLTGWIYPDVVKAQADSTIDRLQIAFWPEYDRHAILVIYRVQLAADTFLPAQVRLPIPSEVGDPFAVAWQDEGGQLLVADYTSETQGSWKIITLTSSGLAAQLEYYMEYEVLDTARSFTFHWPEGFPVENMSYEVQQPFSAEDFKIIPPSDRSITGNDGLLYHLADLGIVSSSSSMSIEFSYSNPTDQLSTDVIVTPAPLPPSGSVTAEGATPDIFQLMPWLLGGLGIILVFVGIFFYLQSRREPVGARRKRRSSTRQRPTDREDENLVDASTSYCHQCGTRASVSDHFCRHCGVRLRR